MRQGQRIQELVGKIAEARDPEARELLQETLETVLGFYGHGLERVFAVIGEAGEPGARVREALLRDPAVRGLLLIHGLHPVPLAERLSGALDQVRPYMASHGGDVELLSLEGDVARLRLVGHCQTCPSSTVTLELAVRAAIEEACPDLAGFEVEGAATPANGAASGSRAGFEHIPAAAPEWAAIEDATSVPEGGFIPVRTDAEPLFICRCGGQLYAYRDHCPACNLPLHLGELAGGVITCSLGHRFDVRRAGQSPDHPGPDGLHLDPLPLLVRDGVVKVALAHGASTGHDNAVPSHEHP
ncbi:MAG: NifU family protein [Verrucomicrobiota bacterium]